MPPIIVAPLVVSSAPLAKERRPIYVFAPAANVAFPAVWKFPIVAKFWSLYDGIIVYYIKI